MLAGEPPFTGATAQAILAQRLDRAGAERAPVRPAVPGRSRTRRSGKALPPVPADRFATTARVRARRCRRRAAGASGGAAAAPRPAAPPTRAPTALGPLLGARRRALIGLACCSPGAAESGSRRRAAVRRARRASVREPGRLGRRVLRRRRHRRRARQAHRLCRGSRSSRAAAPRSTGTTKTPAQIGRELGVRYLLIGTVRWARRAGGTSRVQVSPS